MPDLYRERSSSRLRSRQKSDHHRSRYVHDFKRSPTPRDSVNSHRHSRRDNYSNHSSIHRRIHSDRYSSRYSKQSSTRYRRSPSHDQVQKHRSPHYRRQSGNRYLSNSAGVPRHSSKSKKSKSQAIRKSVSGDLKNAPVKSTLPRPAKRTWKFDSPPREEVPGLIMDDRLDAAGVLGLSCEQQKAARELYVGNLPSNLDVNQLIEFFNAAMMTLNSSGIPGNPVSRAWIAADGHFAFVEFRTIEEATIALQLNGLNCMGYTLKIGRPKTYPVEYSALLTSTRGVFSVEPPSSASALAAATAAAANVGINSNQAVSAAQIAAANLGVMKKTIGDKSERLVMLDLPPSCEFQEKKVKERLISFGKLKVFQYFEIPTKDDVTASGVCIFEFYEPAHQKALLRAVRNNDFGKMKVTVLPAEEAINESRFTEAMDKAGIKEALGGELMRPQVPTRVIMLTNIVTSQELFDDKEYFDIVDDIQIECSQFGEVSGVEIPRPKDVESLQDLGYAYVKFAKLHEAGAARKALSGRKFASRTVEAHYFSEKLFDQKSFHDPQPNFDLSGRLE